MSRIEITVSAGWLNENDLWREYCELSGTNPWAMNEGLMSSDEQVMVPDELIGRVMQNAQEREGTPMKEWYGSVNKMPEDVMQERLAAAIETKREIEAEIARRAAFTPNQRLADRIHPIYHLRCDCDYHYSEWPETRGCRGETLVMVNRIMALEIEPEKLDKLLGVLEGKEGR